MMWWKKKPIEAPAQLVKTVSNTLTIRVPWGKIAWSVKAWPHKGWIDQWKPFYRWYFGRPQSKAFIMHHTEGETMLRRVDIISWEVRVV